MICKVEKISFAWWLRFAAIFTLIIGGLGVQKTGAHGCADPPELLGSPSPANGVLNAGDEISVTFNRDIQNETVNSNCFTVTGVLNASYRAEPSVGLSFNGSGWAQTEMPIYNDSSFTIEGWLLYPGKGAGTVFAYGDDNSISLSLTNDGKARVRVGRTEYTSTTSTLLQPSKSWKYIGMAYDRSKNTVTAWVTGDDETSSFDFFPGGLELPTGTRVTTQGILYAGNNAIHNAGYTGALGTLHFYNKVRTSADASATMNLTKSGKETNLIGYWEIEEGEGTTAKDKSGDRDLTLHAQWYIRPASRSLQFDGNKPASYAQISNLFSFDANDDLSLEFRFKTARKGAATMLAAGLSASIGFDATGQLILADKSGIRQQVLAPAGLQDDKWHHVALSVKRNGLTNALIDGKITASFNSAGTIGAVEGTCFLGAKTSMPANTIEVKVANDYTGYIDELRVWNYALSTEIIRFNKNHKLNGDEVGLEACYPFETTEPDANNGKPRELLTSIAGKGIPVSNIHTVGYGAPMTPARQETQLTAVNVAASSNKIVIEPNPAVYSDYRLDGVTLKISMKALSVFDQQHNPAKPVTWTVFVNRNRLLWDNSSISLTKAANVPQSFSARILNTENKATNYSIDNMPAWLTVDEPSGTLKPLESKELNFSVFAGTGIGNYEAVLNLTTGDKNSMSNRLPVKLKVTGKRSASLVNPTDYESTMIINSRRQVSGMSRKGNDDMSAASGDKGTASGEYPANGIAINAVNGIAMGANSHNVANLTEQSIALSRGWNWISANVTNTRPSLLDQVKAGFGIKNDLVKAKNRNYIQYSSKWAGSLDTLSAASMYMVYSNAPTTLNISGASLNPALTTIDIYSGWNWIGYTPQFDLPVDDALAGMPARHGDQIKSRSAYAIYGTNGWTGTLKSMQPGKGYMYYSGNAGSTSFNYPTKSSRSSNLNTPTRLEPFAAPHHWICNTGKYPNTMTVTGYMVIDLVEAASTDLEIAAFVGRECRGSAFLQPTPDYEHKYQAFMMLYGEQGETFTFKIYDHAAGSEYVGVHPSLTFRADAIAGTPDTPFLVWIGDDPLRNPAPPFGINNETARTMTVYPNPVVNAELTVASDAMRAGDLIEIYNSTGMRVATYNATGPKTVLIVGRLTQGTYVVVIPHLGTSAKILKR